MITDHKGVVHIPVVGHYKHLGGFLTRNGSKLQETRVRGAQAWARIGPLRTLLRQPAIAMKHKTTLLKSMAISILQLHAGTWWDLTEGEYRAWQASWFKILGAAYKRNPEGTCEHTTLQQRAHDLQIPMPQEMLLLARLRLLAHILQETDVFMIGAIMENHRIMQDRSWWTAVQAALKWMQHQIGPNDTLARVRAVQTTADWEGLEVLARPFKKMVSKTEHAHLLRLRAYQDVVQAEVEQSALLQQNGWQKSDETLSQPAPQHQCAHCNFQGGSAAALAVHEQRKHGERIAVRRFAHDGNCRSCGKQFHTRPRLLTHLHSSNSTCWIALMRMYEPMDAQKAAELDHTDRVQGVALHQKGFKSHDVDLACRRSTPTEADAFLCLKVGPIPLDEPPTEEELRVWSQYGMLPPGNGGRDVTKRGSSTFTVPNVLEDVQEYERGLVQDLAQWHPDNTWVPKPLALNVRFVLIFFSGHRRPQDVADHLHSRSSLVPLSIDTAVCSKHGNVHDCGKWIQLIRSRLVIAAHGGPPCETFTAARWLSTGEDREPKPLRAKTHPWGLPEMSYSELLQCINGSSLFLRVLGLLLLVHLHGGATTLEHPAGPMNPDSPVWTVWMSAMVQRLLKGKGHRLVTFLQGPLGRRFAKPTRLLTGHLPDLERQIYQAYQPGWKATAWLGGRDEKGGWRTSEAKAYPPLLCWLLANSYIEHDSKIQKAEEELTPVGLDDAIKALSQVYDPYGPCAEMLRDFQKEHFTVGSSSF